MRAVLDGKACWIEGNATPFGMYAKLYRHRDEFVVIDDVDALYADRSGVRLLKCLCQTEEEKAVAWHSDARSLERQRHPARVHHQEPRRDHLQRLEDADIMPPLLSAVDPRVFLPEDQREGRQRRSLGVVSSDGYSAIPRWDRAASLRSRFTSGSSAQRTQRR